MPDLFFSPNTIRVISSSGMRLARSVARMGEKKNMYKIYVGKPEGNRPLGPRHIEGIILKWALEKQVGRSQAGFMTIMSFQVT